MSEEERRLRAIALRELGRVFKLVVKREKAREEYDDGAAGTDGSGDMEGGPQGSGGANRSRGTKKAKTAREQMEQALRGMAEQHQEQ